MGRPAKPEAERKQCAAYTSLRRDTYERLGAIARQERRSISQVISFAVEAWLGRRRNGGH